VKKLESDIAEWLMTQEYRSWVCFQMLQKEDFTAAGVEDDASDVEEDLFSAMEKLAINAENGEETEENEDDASSHSPSGSSALSPDNPILDFRRPSSKVTILYSHSIFSILYLIFILCLFSRDNSLYF